MIAAHRRRHRFIFCALAVALPVGAMLAIGLTPPARELASTRSLAPPPAGGAVLWERADLWAALSEGDASGTLDIVTRLQPAAASDSFVLVLDARRDLGRPDLLVYWARTPIADRRALDDATLLGRLGSTDPGRYALPPEVGAGAPGHLALYSLGHQELVANAALPGETR